MLTGATGSHILYAIVQPTTLCMQWGVKNHELPVKSQGEREREKSMASKVIEKKLLKALKVAPFATWANHYASHKFMLHISKAMCVVAHFQFLCR